MSHSLDRAFKNLRLMDARIKDRQEHNYKGAAIRVNSLHEAEDLMRLLVERKAYDEVHTDVIWTEDRGYMFSVTVWFK